MSDETLINLPLDGGTEVTYTMRGLKDDEVDHWAAFCASVFAYKANPPQPSYFGRHFYNDSQRSASLIRVMICNDNISTTAGQDTSAPPEIVGSCRIFKRTISLGGGSSVLAGGIGEVCTDSSHRRRGLSKLLLQDAIRIMTEQNMQLSVLHAALDYFPVYQSSGYAGITSHWSLVTISQAKLAEVNIGASSVRLAEFPTDTDRLMSLHQCYTEYEFCGTVIRTAEYWNNYLSKELEGSLWVLTNREEAVVAWLSIRSRGDNRYQLREFGCDIESTQTGGFGRLLYQAVTDLTDEATATFTLHLPTSILAEIRQDSESSGFVDWASETKEDDPGWMWRTLPLSDKAQNNMSKIAQQFPHLIWPSDSF